MLTRAQIVCVAFLVFWVVLVSWISYTQDFAGTINKKEEQSADDIFALIADKKHHSAIESNVDRKHKEDTHNEGIHNHANIIQNSLDREIVDDLLVQSKAFGQDQTVRFADEFEHTGSDLVMSSEYQLRLQSSDWVDRAEQTRNFLTDLSELSDGLFDLTPEKSLENVREQIFVTTTNCGGTKGTTVRLRNYLWGHQEGKSTIDIKIVSQNGIGPVLKAPFTPGENVTDTSIQKLEKDVHPCKSDKWSKETRITDISFRPIINTCGDLSPWFPEVFKPDFEAQPVTIKQPDFWWQLSQFGYFSEYRTKWKSALTLKYPSFQQAVLGNTAPLSRGEWSLRLYSEDGKSQGEFNQAVIDRISLYYITLITKYGSEGEWPCPETD